MSSNQYDLKSLNRLPLNEKVYLELKTSIINGTLKSGVKLNEIHIAKQLDVSATPVREAFKRLSSEGFVTIEPYIGAMVRIYSHDEIINAYVCREPLEVLMVELATPNLNLDTIQILYDLLEKSNSAETSFSFANYSTQIHNIILDNAKNGVLVMLLDAIKETIIHDRNMSATNADRRKEICKEHKLLIDAMARKNIKEAKKIISLHIRNGLKYISK